MHLAFHSHAEQIFLIISVVCTVLHIAYVQAVTRLQHPFAQLLKQKRTEMIAHTYLRTGIKGYLVLGAVLSAFYYAVLLQYHWYVVASFAAVVSVSMMFAMVRKFRSLTEAELAGARLFMDYDIRMPSIRIKIR